MRAFERSRAESDRRESRNRSRGSESIDDNRVAAITVKCSWARARKGARVLVEAFVLDQQRNIVDAEACNRARAKRDLLAVLDDHHPRSPSKPVLPAGDGGAGGTSMSPLDWRR